MQETRRVMVAGAKALSWAITKRASKRIQRNPRLNGFGRRMHSAIEQKADAALLKFTRAWLRIEPLDAKSKIKIGGSPQK